MAIVAAPLAYARRVSCVYLLFGKLQVSFLLVEKLTFEAVSADSSVIVMPTLSSRVR